MGYLKLFLIALLPAFLLVPSIAGQDTKEELQSKFVDLTKHEGWGPFSPRKGFEPTYYTGTFTVAGESYKVFQLQHSNDQYEERFMFHKVNSEVTFSEKEGGIVYYRYGKVELEGITFDIVGYSEKAGQFVLMEKENVKYAQQGLKAGAKAPLFKTEMLFDGPIALSDYQDKYVLLDFWGTWCGPCLQETPYLKEAYQKYGDQIQFIGIAVDDNKKRLVNYINKENIEWPQIYIPEKPNSTAGLVKKYNVYGYPSMFLIDPKAKIIIGPEQQHRLRGEALSETLEKVLSKE